MCKIVLSKQEEHWYLFELREVAGVVGRLQFWSKGEEAFVHWIEVDKKLQRRRLAVQLYTELRAWCRANGVRWLNGRIENRYALQARNRVFGEPVDVESVEGFDDSSSSILLVVHEIRAPSAPERPGTEDVNSRASSPTPACGSKASAFCPAPVEGTTLRAKMQGRVPRTQCPLRLGRTRVLSSLPWLKAEGFRAEWRMIPPMAFVKGDHHGETHSRAAPGAACRTRGCSHRARRSDCPA